MSGSANLSDGKRQIYAEIVRVTPASESITQLKYRRGISSVDDSQPLVGAQITLSRNALPAIFTDRENNGFSAAVLKAKSQEELKSLCEKRTKVESSRYASYETYMSIIGQRPSTLQKPKTYCLSPKEREQFDALRKARLDLLSVNMVSNIKELNYGNRWEVFKRISRELYDLTGHHGYCYK